MRFRKAFGLSLLTGALMWGAGLAAAQNATPVTYESSVQGAITPAASAPQFSFDGKAGDVLTLTLSSDAALMQSVQPVNLENPFGMPVSLYTGDAPAGTYVSRVALRTDGQHLITVQAAEPNTSAAFTLTLAQSGTTLDDGAQFVQLTPEAPTQTLMFTGTAGEQISLNLQFAMGMMGAMPVVGSGQQPPAMNQEPPQQFSNMPPDGAVVVPATASISVSQNGVVLAQTTEDPANLQMQPPMEQPGTPGQAGGPPAEIAFDRPKTTLELTIPADGIVEVVVTASTFPEVPEGLSEASPVTLDRQVYIEPVSQ